MIDCPNGGVRDALPDYLHDRLASGASRRGRVAPRELRSSRAELSLLRDLRATMRRAPVVDVAAIAAAIPPHRERANRTWVTSWRAAAAVVAIAVGGTSIALLRSRAPDARSDVTPYVRAESTSSRDSVPIAVGAATGRRVHWCSPTRVPEPARVVTSPELAMAPARSAS